MPCNLQILLRFDPNLKSIWEYIPNHISQLLTSVVLSLGWTRPSWEIKWVFFMPYERVRKRTQHCKTQADEDAPKDQEFLDALERS